jgi:hypothetical protein
MVFLVKLNHNIVHVLLFLKRIIQDDHARVSCYSCSTILQLRVVSVQGQSVQKMSKQTGFDVLVT